MVLRTLAPFVVACLVAAGCGPARDAEGHPVAVDGDDAIAVEFDGGTLRVLKGECDEVDPELIREWADRAYRDLSEVWPERTDRFRADGLTMFGMRDAVTRRGRSVNGFWDRRARRIVYKCGVEIVIRHELFHVWCESARLPCDCTWIDHPDGFNLDCTPAS